MQKKSHPKNYHKFNKTKGEAIMNFFTSDYRNISLDFVIYLNPLYDTYDNNSIEDLYDPYDYSSFEKELSIKYSEYLYDLPDLMDWILFEEMHLEKDDNNETCSENSTSDTNIWIHYVFKHNRYGIRNYYITICCRDIRLLELRRTGEVFRDTKKEYDYLTNNRGLFEVNGNLYKDFDEFQNDFINQVNNILFSSFINSNDIRNYLREINYNFSPLEASWIIWHCKHLSLDEKHSHWKYIIDTTEDMPFETSESKGNSFHEFLKRYMSTERKYLDIFINSNKAFYKYEVKVTQSDEYCYIDKNDCCFSSYETCLKAAKDDSTDYSSSEFKDFEVRIIRKEIDSTINYNNRIELYLNKHFKINHMDTHGIPEIDTATLISFECMWFSFPTPYKKGDIIYGKFSTPDSIRTGPMVLNYSASEWYTSKNRKGRDVTDMWMNGYFQDSNGNIYNQSSSNNYMDYEYYPSENLTGKLKILLALSNFLKGNIDISLFVRAYHQILLEESVKDNSPWEYTEEKLKLSGLL